MNAVAYACNDTREDYEIVNGQVYMMASPKASHVRVNGNLHKIFGNYLQGKTCEPFNQFNLFLSAENHFIPDEMIVCNPDIVDEDAVHGAPDLVVEILSKSTAKRDRIDKLFTYAKYGVKEYWIVDPKNKSVEVYLLHDGVLIPNDIYQHYTDEELEQLTKETRESIKSEIKVSLYDDFFVKVDEVFDRVK